MTPPVPDEISYLDRAAVRALLPGIGEQLDLVRDTYVAMSRGQVENPPKIGVHTRPETFIHAMPSYLRTLDVAALKWVGAYPGNPRRGLPYISGLMVLNDPDTGLPLAVMDAAEITTARTAAASGVSIRHLAPPGWGKVAILGFGEQGRRHAEVVGTLHPEARIFVYGGPRGTAAGPGIEVVGDARTAVRDADVVITAGPMTRPTGEAKPMVEASWLGRDCLVVPVDFDAYVSAALAAEADQLVTDDVEQYDHYRTLGYFQDWPEVHESIGDALQKDPHGRLRVACNLGVGAIDAVVAGHVWRAEQQHRLGIRLPR